MIIAFDFRGPYARMREILTDFDVDVESGCYVYRKKPDHHGYCEVRFYGRKYNVHRFFYLNFVGDPKGYHIHHLCENKVCVNIEHMELQTRFNHPRVHGWRVMKESRACHSLDDPAAGGRV